MSESVLAMPVVTPAAAVDLFKRLEAQGRAKGGVQKLTHTLVRALDRTWGTADAKRFSDESGGGWFIDLSDYCDGEMLYGIVRSGPGGSRTLDSVVDADAIESWQRGKALPASSTTPGDEPSQHDGVRLHSPDMPLPHAAAKLSALPSPLDPMLVVIAVGESPSGHAPHEEIRRCTRGEAPALITQLLRHGLGGTPLSEDQIEIWSSFSKPKVEITF